MSLAAYGLLKLTASMEARVRTRSFDCFRSAEADCSLPAAGHAGPLVDRVRQAILAGSAARLARRMDLHNGYRTLGPHATLAQLHPCTAKVSADEDGLLPEWVVFQELVATARVFLGKVRVPRRLPVLVQMQAPFCRGFSICFAQG